MARKLGFIEGDGGPAVQLDEEFHPITPAKEIPLPEYTIAPYTFTGDENKKP